MLALLYENFKGQTCTVKDYDAEVSARMAARIFYERFVCFRFIMFNARIQSCGTYGGFTEMAAIKITWLQFLVGANNRLLDQWR